MLQVLFIDRSDTLRARMAAGLFEKVAEWNGFGRALYPWTCGVDAKQDSFAGLSTRAGLMHQAYLLGLNPKAFARPAERFEPADLDRYDVVIAMDSDIKASILEQVDPQFTDYYTDKVRLLSEYAQPSLLGDAAVQKRGGLALLPREMSTELQPALDELRQVVDVDRPSLTDPSATAVPKWNLMVRSIMLGCAGLVKYLIEVYPPDLPHYDPL